MTPEARRLFDEPLARENTHCLKWDARQEVFHDPDVLPMWVADMDFRSPKAVIDALVRRAEHGAFGYEFHDPARAEAVKGWMLRRHGLKVEDDWILQNSGVIESMRVAVAAFTKPGDAVVINSPVYGPFFGSVEAEGRRVAACPMLRAGGGWQMDYERIEDAFRGGARLFLLCNPHNPVGRVWTREELDRLYGLCARYGAKLVCDEIHSDFIRAGHKHTCVLSVGGDCVQLISATKTFNLAALRHSQVLIADPETRKTFQAEMSRRALGGTNLMGALAQEAAYRTGDEWVDALNEYLDEGRVMMENFFRDRLPQFSLTRSEGTYLLWLDANSTGLCGEELIQAFVKKAGVGFGRGEGFGKEGKGFVRINIATTHANLRKAMEGLEKGFGR